VSNTGGGLVRLFLEDARHYWLQSSPLEQGFVFFLVVVTAVTVVRVAMLVDDLRDPSGDTWHRCAAHVRSIRGLLCLTLLTAAWFASVDWFTVLDQEYTYGYGARPPAVVVLLTASRVATRLIVPLLVATLLCLSWIVCDSLLRRWRRQRAVLAAGGRP
jgi:hypothetical protein